jgi:hypothetical protein
VKTPHSPGPYHNDPDRHQVIRDASGAVIAVCNLAGVGGPETARNNATLLAESWSLLQLLEEAHGAALVNAIAVRMLARPGEQSEEDARAAEDFANRIGAAVARAQGRG